MSAQDGRADAAPSARRASLTFKKKKDRVCFDITYDGHGTATRGILARARSTRRRQCAHRSFSLCERRRRPRAASCCALRRSDITAIEKAPKDCFCTLEDKEHPDGAIRGQLRLARSPSDPEGRRCCWSHGPRRSLHARCDLRLNEAVRVMAVSVAERLRWLSTRMPCSAAEGRGGQSAASARHDWQERARARREPRLRPQDGVLHRARDEQKYPIRIYARCRKTGVPRKGYKSNGRGRCGPDDGPEVPQRLTGPPASARLLGLTTSATTPAAAIGASATRSSPSGSSAGARARIPTPSVLTALDA